ncbi:17571_t:CDS:2 [Cetraspora pellucida]|uniref:17571_t:CDS:1 n=1 Tax=Cetraspora pellucida TaxID=1433469 RepID=A0ACA9NNG7_9GLOM|nr:17571_t:CDS:2 [Cetraspora pellucida]
MFAIITKFVTDHKLTNEISLKELSQYVSEILEFLTDNKEKEYSFSKKQAFALISLQRIGRYKSQTSVPEGPELKAKEVNICQVLDSTSSEKTIKEIAQRQQNIPQVFRLLEKNEEQAKQLLTWIQEAISSEQLRDSRKLGSTYLSAFLKKNEFIPETKSHKPLLPSSLHKLEAVFAVVSNGIKNLSVPMTIAS